MSENQDKYSILNKINSPADLVNLTRSELDLLAEEIRGFLVENVTESGGHLASNLGVVELTIALHRVFDLPRDHIIWDVGHQSYVHKILTGRRDAFSTLRRGGGLSGFTCREESEYDCFGAGHSSTSISAALGFAEADRLSGSDAYTIAVVGDGAFTGGMIHEALNNCNKDLKLIIIINENEMSISKNTGRFANSLAKLRSNPGYFNTKKTTGKIIKKIPLIGKWLFNVIKNAKKALKNAVYGSNYFEDIGLYYIGPVDGNDAERIETVLREAKKLGESVVIHVKTRKGHGYGPAEREPHIYHSVSAACDAKNNKSFSSECGRILCELAESNKDITAITAAMSYGTGLEAFRKAYPDRFFDVGIAEEHALTFAAGLAAAGKRPVAAIYSTFLQRGFDNIIHDIALQNLPVVMCIDRAGLNHRDGVTHNGVFDVAFLSGLPNVRIYTPATFEALERALTEAVRADCPTAVRYPSGGESETVKEEFYRIAANGCPVVAGASLTDDAEVIIVSHGRVAAEAVRAAEILRERGIGAGAVLLERLTPYGEIAEKIECLAAEHPKLREIVFLEEEIRAGGMGMMLSDELRRRGALEVGIELSVIALDDPFERLGRDVTPIEYFGLDGKSVAEKIMNK